MGRSVMLLAISRSGRLVMHLRDDRPGVLHPGCWAGFGGAVEAGEHPDDALRREVLEETGVLVEDAEFLAEVEDEVASGGRGDLVRVYTCRGRLDAADIRLGEGAGCGEFTLDELRGMPVSPFLSAVLKLAWARRPSGS